MMTEKRDLKELLKLIEPLPGGKWDIDELWQGEDYYGPREFEITAKDAEGDICILGYYKATCWVEDLVPFWEIARDIVEEAITRAIEAEYKLASHAPDGHNITNGQFVEMRQRAMKAEAQVAALHKILISRINSSEDPDAALKEILQALAELEGVVM